MYKSVEHYSTKSIYYGGIGMKKKVLCVLTVLIAFWGLCSISVSAMTRDQAVNWAKSSVGTAFNVDGIYGNQCSDFGSAYINYILYGDPYYWQHSGGKGYTTYMGYNYYGLSYPSGWQKIANTPDFVPQPGDIVCFAAGSSNSAGHVAVAVEGSTTSYIKLIEQDGNANGGNGTPAKYATWSYYSQWGNIQGVIRPKWDNAPTARLPIGHLDSFSGGAGTIRIGGWAVDEDTPNTPVEIHVYVGGPAGQGAGYNIGKASINRPGLGWGDNHGFNKIFTVNQRGQQKIYIYAIDTSDSSKHTEIATATVNITNPTPPKATTPTISVSDTNGGKSVTLSCATKGATIYYTRDGSNPTTSSAKYTAPFKVEKNTTIKAIAVASGYTNSAVATSGIIVSQIATPEIKIENAGLGKNITLTCSSPNTTIYYTLDGSNPTTSSTKYTAPFKAEKNTTIKAIAVANGYRNSAVASKEIKVMQSVDINPNGGMINGEGSMQSAVNDYGTSIDLIPTPPEGYDFAGFTADGEGAVMPYGKPLFKDTLFENGVNGMQPYNNGGDGKAAINIERVPASEDCPTNSDYMVKVQSVGKTFPEYGGFCQKVNAKANGIFYHVIVAKIPKGYMIQQDGGGGGKYSTWHTMGNSRYGTGEWETYIFKHTCGTTGDFSTVGEVHIARISHSDWHNWETIDSSQEENPMTWYVAYSNMFDATDITSNRTKDPSFTTSNNGIMEYNNENNGAVTIQREAMEGDSNKYVLKITADGSSRPGYGGFIQSTGSKPNRVYYHFFSAKVPKGYTLNIAYNPCGDNSKHTWITNNKGTGEWANYIYKTECGSTGRFGTFGHVFLTKSEADVSDTATTEEPLTWYVRYSDMVDMTPQYIFNGTGTLTARWSKQRCSKPTSGMKTESVILTSTPITLTGDEGADIYYTLDGTSPTSADELYTEPIYLPEGDVNLRAVAFKEGCTESYYADYNYHVYSDTLEMSTDISTTKSYHNVFSELTDPVPGTYIAAFYDENDVLLQTFTRKVEENTDIIDFKVPRIENAVSAKIFLWDKIENMRPLLESETILLD